MPDTAGAAAEAAAATATATSRTAGALLAVEGVGKRFGALPALDDVSLVIAAGEIHGLLGENGAGKSTLCNIVFGVHRADAGAIRLDGEPYRPAGPAEALRAGVAMVHQHFSLVPDLSVVDNLLLGQARGFLRRGEFAARVTQLSEEFGLAVRPHAIVEDLSVGERQRVEIVKCLMRRPRLLVLDEPTAVLLPDEIDGLLGVCERVAASGCGIVLVTHKLAEIRRTAHRVTVLRLGRVVARSDSPSREIDRLVHAMIGRDLGAGGGAGSVESGDVAGAVLAVDPLRESSSAASTAHAAGGSGSKELSAAATDTPARAMRPAHGDIASHGASSATSPQGGREVSAAADTAVLRIERLGLLDAQGVRRLDGIDLAVGRGEIVGIAGVEGNGQSELVAVLSGMASASEGGFTLGQRALADLSPKALTEAGIGVVPEDRHRDGCVPAMSLALNVVLNQLPRFRRFGLVDRAAVRREALARMQAFDIRAARPDVPFSSLSGGNQQKAVLARELMLPGLKLLVAAQPTRGLDVGAVEAIYGHIRAAAQRGVAVLLASSELDELLAVADRLVVMYRGRLMGACAAAPQNRARIGAWMAGHAA